VKAAVDETDIAQVKINQRAVIILDAYPNIPIDGKVTHLAYDATLTNNVTTYEVDVIPTEIPEFMRSGMTSNVSIEVDGKKNILLIPKTTLFSDEEGEAVLTKNGEKRSMTPIQIGIDDGKMVEVVSGLNENDIGYLKETIIAGKKSKSSNPLFPSGPGRKGGKKK
jgi:multidrug efflux pump subunit AcrA (membrane-fusion protein)